MEETQIPIVVDLDGTLVLNDTLIEALHVLCAKRPLNMLAAVLVLLRGRAHFKQYVFEHATISVSKLKWNVNLIDYLVEQKVRGRNIVLATASDQRIANIIADHLPIFNMVIASAAGYNMKGRNKAKVLVDRFGFKMFDYIGDSRADLPVWAEARKRLTVTDVRTLGKEARSLMVTQIFPNQLGR